MCTFIIDFNSVYCNGREYNIARIPRTPKGAETQSGHIRGTGYRENKLEGKNNFSNKIGGGGWVIYGAPFRHLCIANFRYVRLKMSTYYF
jgi:hypothetical protein